MDTNWFTSWFNTPYYHILYKHRDDADAQLFMKNITQFLDLPIKANIADIPCGKGRHSVYLNSLGYTVTGGDLSENSIQYANQFENDSLSFEVWDMRKPLENCYDAVFNLFTSFGYFDSDEDEIKVLKALKAGLKQNGKLVLDFLNVERLKHTLVKSEVKVVDNITFDIKREIKNGFILKHISFFADDKQHNFTEKVKYIDLEKFKSYFNKANLNITATFGDYKLSEFDSKTSERLILIAE